jgi:recombinational DNA repair protein RecR
MSKQLDDELRNLTAQLLDAKEFATATQDAVDNLNQALCTASQQNVRAGQKLVILQKQSDVLVMKILNNILTKVTH